MEFKLKTNAFQTQPRLKIIRFLSFRNGVHMTNIPTPDSVHIQAPEGQGCPKCGGYVYHADQVYI